MIYKGGSRSKSRSVYKNGAWLPLLWSEARSTLLSGSLVECFLLPAILSENKIAFAKISGKLCVTTQNDSSLEPFCFWPLKISYLGNVIGAWLSLVEHLLWEQGVARSNRVAPRVRTILTYILWCPACPARMDKWRHLL